MKWEMGFGEPEVLNTRPERAFDDLARLASALCGTSMAAITWVKGGVTRIKAQVGLPASEENRFNALCEHSSLGREVFMVRDARDSSFSEDPWIQGSAGVRFFAGLPLRAADGSSIGTLCVMDPTARELTPAQLSFLQALAAQVLDQVALRSGTIETSPGVNRFQDIVEFTPSIIYVVDVQNAFIGTFMTGNVERILGHRASDFSERPHFWKEHVHPDDLPRVLQSVEMVLREGHGKNQYRFRRADGSYAWVLDEQKLIRDVHGQPKELIGFWMDITEERELLERFEQITSNVEEVIWITDPQKQKMIYASPAYDRIWKRSRLELESDAQAFLNSIHPEDRPRVKAAFPKQAEGTWDEVYRLLHSDGQIRWIRSRAFPVRDSAGNVVRVLGTEVDITEQRQAHQLMMANKDILVKIAQGTPTYQILRETIEMVEGQLEGAIGVISVYDPSTQRLQIQAGPSLPAGFREGPGSFGVPVDPTFGTCGAAAFHRRPAISEDISTDPLWTAFRETIQGRFGFNSCISVPIIDRKDQVLGTFCAFFMAPHRFTQFDTHLIETATQLAGVALERERAQDLLERERLRSFAASKMSTLGEMAGGVAHEINNPLAIIHGKAGQLKQLLAKNDKTLDQDRLTVGLEKIEQTAMRISKIIRGLRAFSRNSDRDPFIPVPLRSIIEDSLELSRERFRYRGIDLRVAVVPETSIECRPSQIAQVLLNLLSNAFDAVAGLPGAWVEIVVIDDGLGARIQVTDSGLGIPDRVAERIMEPFFTTKEVGKGTGLGLSIAKGLIEDHGGSLKLDASHPSTRFEIRLPKHQQPA